MSKESKNKIKFDTAPLKQYEAMLGNLDKFLADKKAIFLEACTVITPLVQRIMLDSLKKSGLQRISGDLEKVVSNSIIYPTRKGLRIGPPRNLTPQEYAKGGALQYGAHRGLNGFSDKARSKIKKNVEASGSAKGPLGSVLVSAHPYFNIDDGQLAEIAEAFNKEIIRIINRFLHSQRRNK